MSFLRSTDRIVWLRRGAIASSVRPGDSGCSWAPALDRFGVEFTGPSLILRALAAAAAVGDSLFSGNNLRMHHGFQTAALALDKLGLQSHAALAVMTVPEQARVPLPIVLDEKLLSDARLRFTRDGLNEFDLASLVADELGALGSPSTEPESTTLAEREPGSADGFGHAPTGLA